MPNRNLLPTAFVAGLVAGSPEADIIAVPKVDANGAETISRDAGADFMLAEMMYAGDDNVGVSPPAEPITIRAPSPVQTVPESKSGDVRGTGKTRFQNDEDPRRQPRTSKKGA